MSDPGVRIVRLPSMRVVCAHGFGAEPERIAQEKVDAFVAEKGLMEFRQFGFNNPNPSPGSPNYGYDIWVTVGPDVESTEDVEIKTFAGGLYGVARCEGLRNIGARWQELATWREDSGYHVAHHQWLENLLVGPHVPPEDFVFDLYIPIAE